jgi:hypothetical protein
LSKNGDFGLILIDVVLILIQKVDKHFIVYSTLSAMFLLNRRFFFLFFGFVLVPDELNAFDLVRDVSVMKWSDVTIFNVT